MKRREDSFQATRSARLLTPDAASAAVLWGAVQRQASLKATPLSEVSLQVVSETPQTVFCESSGSSGPAKLIRRSPMSWRASFEVNKQRFGIGPQDVYAALGNLGHSLTLYAALESMHLGCGLAFLGDLAPRQQAAALREHRVSILYATPSQLALITRADADLFPDVSRILVGGGRLDSTLRDLLGVRFSAAEVVEFFGSSETSFITLSDEQTPLGSVGRPYPGVTLRIGEACGADEMGEIWVKSPYLFDGYETGSSTLTRWQNGFLSIGEMGKLNAAGYLYLQGRRSRMVTVADQNVFPEAIEAVLMAQTGIEAAAVITPTDPLRSHVIVAAVVGEANAAVLRKVCRAELGAAAVPRKIWNISSMPMLPAGKPDLQRLESLWEESKE